MTTVRHPEHSPSSHVRPVEVLSVKTGIPVVVRFLAGYQGILTHYSRSGPVWCPGPGECPSTVHKGKLIWKGYAAVQQWLRAGRQWQPDVLEITERLEEVLRGRDLRGEVWLLERKGAGHPSDPLFGAFCSRADLVELGPSFDPLPVVQRVYHSTALRFGAPNPMPPKILLPNVTGSAPVLPRELPSEEPRPLSDEEKQWANKRLDQWEQAQRKHTEGNGQHESKNGAPRDR